LGFSGTAVAQWRDKSGFGKHQTLTGSATTWNGPGRGIELTNLSNIVGAGPVWTGSLGEIAIGAAMASRATGGQNNGLCSLCGSNPITPNRLVVYAPNNNGYVFDVGTSNSPDRIQVTQSASLYVPRLVSAVSSVAQNFKWFSINGRQIMSAAGPIAITNSGLNFSVGMVNNALTLIPSQGPFFEFVFHTDTSLATSRRLEGYLAWRWDALNPALALVNALVGGHPFKNRPPLIGG
jgi:hypothetical protein